MFVKLKMNGEGFGLYHGKNMKPKEMQRGHTAKNQGYPRTTRITSSVFQQPIKNGQTTLCGLLP